MFAFSPFWNFRQEVAERCFQCTAVLDSLLAKSDAPGKRSTVFRCLPKGMSFRPAAKLGTLWLTKLPAEHEAAGAESRGRQGRDV